MTKLLLLTLLTIFSLHSTAQSSYASLSHENGYLMGLLDEVASKAIYTPIQGMDRLCPNYAKHNFNLELRARIWAKIIDTFKEPGQRVLQSVRDSMSLAVWMIFAGEDSVREIRAYCISLDLPAGLGRPADLDY